MFATADAAFAHSGVRLLPRMVGILVDVMSQFKVHKRCGADPDPPE